MTDYMFDTNIFNKISNDKINVHDLPNTGKFFVTHVQRDEIENTKDLKRRKFLQGTFNNLNHSHIPTESGCGMFLVGMSVNGPIMKIESK